MDVIDMPGEVFIILYGMLPEPALPNTPFPFSNS